MMNINVKRKDSGNSTTLLKEFSTIFKRSRILPKVKKERFEERKKSLFFRKKEAIRKIDKTKEVTRLKKIGKLK